MSAELLVRRNSSLLVAAAFPTIVDVHINVAPVLHPLLAMASASDRISGSRNFAGTMIPTVPSHRRGRSRAGIGCGSSPDTAES